MTTTLTALRAAICAEPADDTVRLMFADALEENGGEHEARWAELIRAQIELAAAGGPPYPKCSENAINMRSGERCGRCDDCRNRDRSDAILRELEPVLPRLSGYGRR